MDNTVFFVNDEPYCIWEANVRERNLEFLNGIDREYFVSLANIYADWMQADNLDSAQGKQIAVCIRMSYHHALETLFSLIGATIQAADCVYGWMARCDSRNLRRILSRIEKSDPHLWTKTSAIPVSWPALGQIIFQCFMPGEEKQKTTAELFSAFWRRLSVEFLNPNHIDEFNSLKHGFRVRPGGFFVSVGPETKYGVPPPKEAIKNIGGSRFGSTFFNVKKIQTKGQSLSSRRQSVNWSLERTLLHLQLIGMSIGNIVSALRIANGVAASECRFDRPEDDADFDKSWDFKPSVLSSNFDFVLDEEQIPRLTREELVSRFSSPKTGQP